jgi:hypothetical protein
MVLLTPRLLYYTTQYYMAQGFTIISVERDVVSFSPSSCLGVHKALQATAVNKQLLCVSTARAGLNSTISHAVHSPRMYLFASKYVVF